MSRGEAQDPDVNMLEHFGVLGFSAANASVAVASRRWGLQSHRRRKQRPPACIAAPASRLLDGAESSSARSTSDSEDSRPS